MRKPRVFWERPASQSQPQADESANHRNRPPCAPVLALSKEQRCPVRTGNGRRVAVPSFLGTKTLRFQIKLGGSRMTGGSVQSRMNKSHLPWALPIYLKIVAM